MSNAALDFTCVSSRFKDKYSLLTGNAVIHTELCADFDELVLERSKPLASDDVD